MEAKSTLLVHSYMTSSDIRSYTHSHRNLKNITLCANPFSTSVPKFCHFLESISILSNLCTLRFSNVHLSHSEVIYTIETIKTSFHHLRVIDFSGNNLNDPEVVHLLATLVSQLPLLHTLNLSHCHLNAANVVLFLHHFFPYKKTELEFNNKPSCSDGFPFHINLSNNNIPRDSDLEEKLLDFVQKNHRISKIHLSGNFITNSCAAVVDEICRKHEEVYGTRQEKKKKTNIPQNGAAARRLAAPNSSLSFLAAVDADCYPSIVFLSKLEGEEK